MKASDVPTDPAAFEALARATDHVTHFAGGHPGIEVSNPSNRLDPSLATTLISGEPRLVVEQVSYQFWADASIRRCLPGRLEVAAVEIEADDRIRVTLTRRLS